MDRRKKMSIFKILTKKSTLICLGILVALIFAIPAEVLAQATDQVSQNAREAVKSGKTGPFALFLARGSTLFAYTRNALFVVAAFAFLAYAYQAIDKGDIQWKQLLMLIVALVLLGVAGFIVSYLANPDKPTQVQENYGGLTDTSGWE